MEIDNRVQKDNNNHTISQNFDLSGHHCIVLGNSSHEYFLIQPVDDHDLGLLDKEYEFIASSTSTPFQLVAFLVGDWLADLTPWSAPPAFGKRPFGEGARTTLNFIENELIPFLLTSSGLISPQQKIFDVERKSVLHDKQLESIICKSKNVGDKDMHQYDENEMLSYNKCNGNQGNIEGCFDAGKPAKFIIGGYSLAGLFALWCGYQTPIFDCVVAASPSVWYPKWIDYASTFRPLAHYFYLSMGNKEGKTRNRMMASIEKNLRQQSELFYCQGVEHIVEWNEGGHFQQTAQRTAKGFVRAIQSQIKS